MLFQAAGPDPDFEAAVSENIVAIAKKEVCPCVRCVHCARATRRDPSAFCGEKKCASQPVCKHARELDRRACTQAMVADLMKQLEALGGGSRAGTDAMQTEDGTGGVFL